MESHMSSLNGKICNTFNKIRGALPYLTEKNRQKIIEAKIKSLLMPSMPLIKNQPERIKSRAETMLMRINRWVQGGNNFKESSIKICKKINRPLPE